MFSRLPSNLIAVVFLIVLFTSLDNNNGVMSQRMTCDQEKCLNGESSRVGRNIVANLEMNNPGMVAKKNTLKQENYYKINNQGMVSKRAFNIVTSNRHDNDLNCNMKPRQLEEMVCVFPGCCVPITYTVKEKNCEVN